MKVSELKKREQQLREAHKQISEEIEKMLDHRIKIVGAIEENLYMQKRSIKKTASEGEK